MQASLRRPCPSIIVSTPDGQITSIEMNADNQAAEPMDTDSSHPPTNGAQPQAAPKLPPTPPTSEPKETVQFPSPYPSVLRTSGEADQAAERARLEARKRRKKEKEARERDRQASIDSSLDAALTSAADGAAPATSTTPGTPAPTDIAPVVKMSKKEREKAAKEAKASESVMRAAANTTANLALGGGKKYSWMTAAASSPAPSFGAGAGMGPAAGRGAGGVKASSNAATEAAAGAARVGRDPLEEKMSSAGAWKRVGELREDGESGKGVQVRDLVGVLEWGGRRFEEKILVKALAKGLRDEADTGSAAAQNGRR